MLIEAGGGEDVTSLGDGLAAGTLLVGAAADGAWELAIPAKVTVEVNVDICGDDAADAASVCADCGTELGLGPGPLGILDDVADCRIVLELSAGALCILEVAADCRTVPELGP